MASRRPRYVIRTNPSTPNPRGSKWDRCVREVQARGTAVNAYAVCTASVGPRPRKPGGARHRRNPSRPPTYVIPYRANSAPAARDNARGAARGGDEGLASAVRSHPLAAVLVAGLAGAAVGYLIGRPRPVAITVTPTPPVAGST